ncbi:fused MFS/spermidine synthase [Actinomadura hibisca]|uniref:fused MFS/spermidine synthase n=1 Tax=Actinomadura hibisca TaxID=68565 RepID=UPI00082A2CB9|nr:fused MFS/spermidine synthase [Actinomadura hibisca]
MTLDLAAEAVAPPVTGPGGRRRPPAAVVGLFVLTSLVGASLIFAVEPMVAKLLLPAYGGSPMVWNTSVLFFQLMMLIGYAYAHWSQRFGRRRQPAVHVVLIVLPLFLLPVALPAWAKAPDSWWVAPWLLLVLTVMVGAPFAALSATGPLVQRWYSWSGLPRAEDPYFLYAAGNVGSLLALLSYPFVIEPLVGLAAQRRGWAVGYAVFVVLMAVCALVVVRSRGGSPGPRAPEAEGGAETRAETGTVAETRTETGTAGEAVAGTEAGAEAEEESAEPIGWRRRVKWVLLAALPSSLMLGATTHISTDIAPVPLMWVVPLALYLVTFIVAFGVRRRPWLGTTAWALAASSAVLSWTLLLFSSYLGVLMLPVDLLWVVLAGLACHGLLAEDRPGSRHLTEFFLYVSLGGALGGSFNGLLAPLLFNWGAEFPLAIAGLAGLALVIARSGDADGAREGEPPVWRRVVRLLPFLVPPLAVLGGSRLHSDWLLLLGLFALVACAVRVLWRQPRFTVVSAVLGVVAMFFLQTGSSLVQERTFFGSYRVEQQDDQRRFLHGTTLHGWQLTRPDERGLPTSYYARTGPLGDVFTAYGPTPAAGRTAVVGLGTGTVAAYGRPGQRMDFYEIDPEVVRIARSHFTYLRDCACEVRTRTGDGRLRLAEVPDGSYGIIVLDAFSSDAIPTHLLTREALTLYASKLAPGGVLVFNISNRNLDLRPVLASTARAAGLVAAMGRDGTPPGRVSAPSAWSVVARSEADLRPLTSAGRRWETQSARGPVWTDSYSSVVGALRRVF